MESFKQLCAALSEITEIPEDGALIEGFARATHTWTAEAGFHQTVTDEQFWAHVMLFHAALEYNMGLNPSWDVDGNLLLTVLFGDEEAGQVHLDPSLVWISSVGWRTRTSGTGAEALQRLVDMTR
jgi:hypothetical protein